MHKEQTPYGMIAMVGPVERYADGSLKSCTPGAACVLETAYGPLVPQYTTDDLRRKTVGGVELYPDGSLKSVALEEAVEIDTPAGRLPAELVTFHPGGALKRVFPLNGKLTAYWTQEDEARLAREHVLETPQGPMRARVLGVCFSETGALRSITLWPGESLSVCTTEGLIRARIGVSYYPSGCVRSLEPAEPTLVATAAGDIMAYDPDAVGVNGDSNSLVFSPEGEVEAVTTTLTSLAAYLPDGSRLMLTPGERDSLCSDTARETEPMRLTFSGGVMRAGIDPKRPPMALDLTSTVFFPHAHMPLFNSMAQACGAA